MTTEIKYKTSLVNSLIDEAFDTTLISNYQFVIQIGADNLLLAVKQKAENKFIAFENFSFQNVHGFDALPELMDKIKSESKLFSHKYKSVVCIVVNSVSTLIPTPLFEDEKRKMYLKFNSALEGDEFILTDEIKNSDSKNIFAIPFHIKTKLDYLFNNITYHHFSSILISNILTQNKNITIKKIYVHIQATHFEAIVTEGKKLVFYNSFIFYSAEDFIYYVLFVYEQLQLNPESDELILIGELERNSAIFSLTQKYIRNLKFGERNSGMEFSYQLQTLPKHSYYNLFSNFIQ